MKYKYSWDKTEFMEARDGSGERMGLAAGHIVDSMLSGRYRSACRARLP